MVEPENNTFLSPVKINAGRKALAHIPFELAAMGVERPLLITTKALVKQKAVAKVVNGLRDSRVPLGIYDDVGEHAHMKTVLRLTELFQDGGFDAIIALGSGSVMHTAKVLNLAVTENTLELAPFTTKGDRTIGRLKPHMAIPACSGDGYETTSMAYVDDLAFSSLLLMPHIVMVDPEVFIPEDPLKGMSGAMSALTHAVEGFVGTGKNPFVDAYAHTAIQMMVHHLAEALGGGRRWKVARSAVAAAEAFAGCAFSNGPLGLTHILGMAVGRKAAYPEGLCMGILLPYVLDHLSTRDDFFVDSLLLPMADPETFALTSSELRTGKVLTLIQELQFALYESTKGKLPMTLEDVGIQKDQLKPMAASLTECTSNDVNEEACLMILERALKGDPIDLN
ncbi:MAG: iron-containing alcohol dehydrogenase [Deltaproteobacteria bacterium]|nr:iron-containing alcohol dehydrogenase [Deltaproteobacteria bacterium]